MLVMATSDQMREWRSSSSPGSRASPTSEKADLSDVQIENDRVATMLTAVSSSPTIWFQKSLTPILCLAKRRSGCVMVDFITSVVLG